MNGVLDIAALRSLTSIADSGGFRRAAESLHLSQPAVSQHVRKLEQVCGHSLVERGARGVRFTAEGELLVAEARKVLAAHDDALDRVRTAASIERSLVIGTTEHAADVLLPVITAHLRKNYPEQAVRFRIDRRAALEARIDRGSVDASVLLGPASGPDTCAAGWLPLRWFGAIGWQRIRPATALPLVVIDGPCTIRNRALKALSDKDIGYAIVCEAGHLAGAVQAVRAGVGVALLANLGTPAEGLEELPELPAVLAEQLHVRGRDGAPTGLVPSIATVVSRVVTAAAAKGSHSGK